MDILVSVIVPVYNVDPFLRKMCIRDRFWNFIFSAMIIFLFTGLIIYFIGLNKHESTFLVETIKKKIKLKG